MIKGMGLTALLLVAMLSSMQPVSAQEASAADGAAIAANNSLQGIWKANLGESEIVIAISQSGDALFGLAKYEGEYPWNGAISGSTYSLAQSSGASTSREAFFCLVALEGDAVTSTSIRAEVQDEAMNGTFVRAESSGKASRGVFSAIMISPDTSGYTPAAISPLAEGSAEDENAAQNGSVNATATGDEQNAIQESAGTETAASRFKDVTKLAKGINPNILPRMAPL